MRYLKAFAVAMVATMALISLAGAGSASAAATLCSKNEALCAVGNTYGIGTKLELNLVAGSKAVFEAAMFKVECKKSEIKFTYEDKSTGGNPTGKLSTLTFAECGAGCGVKVTAGSVEITTEGTVSNGNGFLNTTSSTEFTIECNGSSCILLTRATGQGLGPIAGGAPAKLTVASGIPWKAGDDNEVVCGQAVKWEGEYEVTSPKPLFVI